MLVARPFQARPWRLPRGIVLYSMGLSAEVIIASAHLRRAAHLHQALRQNKSATPNEKKRVPNMAIATILVALSDIALSFGSVFGELADGALAGQVEVGAEREVGVQRLPHPVVNRGDFAFDLERHRSALADLQAGDPDRQPPDFALHFDVENEGAGVAADELGGEEFRLVALILCRHPCREAHLTPSGRYGRLAVLVVMTGWRSTRW